MRSTPSPGLLAGAYGYRFWQPGEALPPVSVEESEDPWWVPQVGSGAVSSSSRSSASWSAVSVEPGAMTSLDEVDWAELDALLASVPLPPLDDGEAVSAPEVAVLEQGRLDLGSAVALRARAAAVEHAHDLAVRAARWHAQDVDALVQVWRLTPQTTDLGSPHKALALELAGARGLGQQQALREVRDALRLTEVLPLTLAGLRAGTLLLGQSRAIVAVTEHCAPEIASEAERRLFADPRASLLSPSDLRLRLTRLLLEVETELDPAAQDERERTAADGRRVSSFPLPDGMAGLYAEWTAQQGLSHAAALDELCRRVKAWDLENGYTRTATQRRADVLAALPGWVLDLLDRPASPGPRTPAGTDTASDPTSADDPVRDTAHGDTHGVDDPDGAGDGSDATGEDADHGTDRDPAGATEPAPPPPPLPLPDWLTTPSRTPRTIVNVHIPLASALGISQAAGYLERHGWISAPHARRLLPGAQLRPVHVDEHGQPLHTTTQPRATTARHDNAPDDVDNPDRLDGDAPGNPGTGRDGGDGDGGDRGDGGGGSSGRQPRPAGPLPICADPSAQIHSAPHPTAPAAPATPAAPVAPAGPIAPVAPVAPVASVGPVTPLAPATPLAPLAPLAPELNPFGLAPTDWGTARPRTTPRDVRALLVAWGALPPPTVITTPEPQYEPSAALARHIRTRDLRCTGPGCAMPSHQSELDHLEPYGSGGPTAAVNLAPKSHRCHDAKTHGGWTTTRHPDSSTTWTSPLARRTWTPAFWPTPPAVTPGTTIPEAADTTREPAHWAHEQRNERAPQLARELDAQSPTSPTELRLGDTPGAARPGVSGSAPDAGAGPDWLHPGAGPNDTPPPF